MEDLKLIISQNITELRHRKGMTQAELAEKLNYSDKAVSKWERGASVPDIAVLKKIAELFGVTIDYLVSSEHDETDLPEHEDISMRHNNHGFITGMSIVLVWLIATVAYVSAVPICGKLRSALSYIYALPISAIVWLIFNALWFNSRRNFLIISLLMWSFLISLFLTLLVFGHSLPLIFCIGIPGQIIIFLWSGIRVKK